MKYDKVIIGAGIYGLYSAWICGKRKEKVLVLEIDSSPFGRATYINQARVHLGYHYPRSYSTAKKSANYFDRFNKMFGFSELTEFDQIYATSSKFSWTDAKEFKKFCKNVNIRCDDVPITNYFKEGMVDGAFLTDEYTYDSKILRDYFLDEIKKLDTVEIRYSTTFKDIKKVKDEYVIELTDGDTVRTGFLLNATYASVNQVIKKLGYEPFKIKYELCEIILCKVNDKLKNVGLTVMDGPFFSIMPFGKTGYHSLTSVTFTPHITSYDDVPTFPCQEKSNGYCKPECLGNCNNCPAKPKSAWPYMSSLAKKYMQDDLEFEYVESLYSMKPILMASEIDDSRPTVIKIFSKKPTFVSVLSGKINTIFDLDEVLKDE